MAGSDSVLCARETAAEAKRNRAGRGAADKSTEGHPASTGAGSSGAAAACNGEIEKNGQISSVALAVGDAVYVSDPAFAPHRNLDGLRDG